MMIHYLTNDNIFTAILSCSCIDGRRIKRQFFPQDNFGGFGGPRQFPPNGGDQFGNQFFPDIENRYPTQNFNQRPNQQFNQQRPNQGNFNQQRPNQGNFNQGGGNQQFNQGGQQRPAQGGQQGGNPQQFNQGGNQQQPTQPPTATQPPTTLAPVVQDCVDRCINSTPSQYNPVCGSDQQNYHNEERLLCARDCGVGEYFFCKMIKP